MLSTKIFINIVPTALVTWPPGDLAWVTSPICHQRERKNDLYKLFLVSFWNVSNNIMRNTRAQKTFDKTSLSRNHCPTSLSAASPWCAVCAPSISSPVRRSASRSGGCRASATPPVSAARSPRWRARASARPTSAAAKPHTHARLKPDQPLRPR